MMLSVESDPINAVTQSFKSGKIGYFCMVLKVNKKIRHLGKEWLFPKIYEIDDYKPVVLLTQLAYGKLHFGEQILQTAHWIQIATDGLPNHLFYNSRWVHHFPRGRCLPGLSWSSVYPSCHHWESPQMNLLCL